MVKVVRHTGFSQTTNPGLNLSSALNGCETCWLYPTSPQVPLSKEDRSFYLTELEGA